MCYGARLMKSTIITENGEVACPRCGAVNSFTPKRTGKAKLLGAATVGVGALLAPKRLKCNGCGTNLKRGKMGARAVQVRVREISAEDGALYDK